MLAQDEKLGSIMCEPSTHMRKQAYRLAGTRTVVVTALSSWKGPGARHLKQSGSLPYISMEALDNRSPNWSATRSPMA